MKSMSDRAILEELGRRLRRERLNRNLTQSELSERSGVSVATIRKFEGGANVSLETLIALLRALGLVERLDAFLPAPPLSPIELAKLGGKRRERATGSRTDDG